MKRIKWMLAVLLAVAITAPAFAQSRDPHANEKWGDNKAAVSAAIERAAVKAQQARRTNPYFKGGDPHNAANYEKCRWCGEPLTDENLSRRCPADPDVHCLPAPKSDAKAHTCYRCGKSFRAGQHCSAADYTALCANSPEQERQLNEAAAERAAAAEKASTCPKCGEAYDIDVLYHGMEHHCAAEEDNQANTPVCVRCGEKIISAGQHCSAIEYVGLCTPVRETPRTQPVSDTNAVCPKCGKAYSIDERYHGEEHQCDVKTDKKATAPVCVRCGEKIISAGQHCSAIGSVGLCTPVREAPRTQPASDTNAVCPKCGKAYSIDERYHGVEHQCQK